MIGSRAVAAPRQLFLFEKYIWSLLTIVAFRGLVLNVWNSDPSLFSFDGSLPESQSCIKSEG